MVWYSRLFNPIEYPSGHNNESKPGKNCRFNDITPQNQDDLISYKNYNIIPERKGENAHERLKESSRFRDL